MSNRNGGEDGFMKKVPANFVPTAGDESEAFRSLSDVSESDEEEVGGFLKKSALEKEFEFEVGHEEEDAFRTLESIIIDDDDNSTTANSDSDSAKEQKGVDGEPKRIEWKRDVDDGDKSRINPTAGSVSPSATTEDKSMGRSVVIECECCECCQFHNELEKGIKPDGSPSPKKIAEKFHRRTSEPPRRRRRSAPARVKRDRDPVKIISDVFEGRDDARVTVVCAGFADALVKTGMLAEDE